MCIRDRKKSRDALRAKRNERQSTLRIWEERLSGNQITGEWTRLLIRDLGAWLERPHGELDFWLTQVMSGHGVFNKYLHRMGISTSPECSNCDIRGRDDDAWHTLFECPAFNDIREEAQRSISALGEEPLTPESLVPVMLRSSTGWDQVAAFVAAVLRKKMEAERERQRWRSTIN